LSAAVALVEAIPMAPAAAVAVAVQLSKLFLALPRLEQLLSL
jgi:hypothetical protein